MIYNVYFSGQPPNFCKKLTSSIFTLQTAQPPDCAALVDTQGVPLPVEETNGVGNEGSCTGSASCNGSVVDEEAPEEEPVEEQTEDHQSYNETYVETLAPQPVHVSHVMSSVPQPYIYPGHYMFGPSLVNVNGWFPSQLRPCSSCSQGHFSDALNFCSVRGWMDGTLDDFSERLLTTATSVRREGARLKIARIENSISTLLSFHI